MRPRRPLTGRERDTILAALRLYMSLNSGEVKVLDPDLLAYDQLGEVATNSGMWPMPDNDFIVTGADRSPLYG